MTGVPWPRLTWRRGLPLRPLPTRRRRVGRPGDLPLPLWPLLLVAALVASVAAWNALRSPDRLADTQLSGPRTLNGPACVAVAADVSGSMSSIVRERQEATAALWPWLRDNLGPQDMVALAVFADDAVVTGPAVSAGSLPTRPPAEVAPGSGGTTARTAVDALGAEFSGAGCAALGLIVISDGEFGDPPPDLAAGLSEAAVTRTWVLNPHGGGRPQPLQDPLLAGLQVVDIQASNADELGLAYGQLIAELTGQDLTRR